MTSHPGALSLARFQSLRQSRRCSNVTNNVFRIGFGLGQVYWSRGKELCLAGSMPAVPAFKIFRVPLGFRIKPPQFAVVIYDRRPYLVHIFKMAQGAASTFWTRDLLHITSSLSGTRSRRRPPSTVFSATCLGPSLRRVARRFPVIRRLCHSSTLEYSRKLVRSASPLFWKVGRKICRENSARLLSFETIENRESLLSVRSMSLKRKRPE